MKIMAFNSSTLGITGMVGDSIKIDNINIIVGSDTSQCVRHRRRRRYIGMWDPGETIFLYGLDLNRKRASSLPPTRRS